MTTTTSTLAELAASVEAGLAEGASVCIDCELAGVKYYEQEAAITAAQAALTEYRRRVEALAAFVEGVATCDYDIEFTAGKLHSLMVEARALLAGLEEATQVYPPKGATLLSELRFDGEISAANGQTFTFSTTLPGDVGGLDGEQGTGEANEYW